MKTIKLSKLLWITATFITELAKECGITITITECYKGKTILGIALIGKMALSGLEEHSDTRIAILDDTNLKGQQPTIKSLVFQLNTTRSKL